MRYTLSSGLAQISSRVRLKFAAMNLKKLARWKAKRQSRLFFLVFSACTYLLCFAGCLDTSQAARFSTGWEPPGNSGGLPLLRETVGCAVDYAIFTT